MVTLIQNNDLSAIEAADVAVVDFSASWCGPCKMLAPVVHELAEEVSDVAFFNVDVDENPALARKFTVMSVPSLFLLKKGELVARSVGFQPKSDLENWINGNR